MSRHLRQCAAGALTALMSSALIAGGSGSALPPVPTYEEPMRPQLHFTPPAHWMNDPNGLLWSDGEYHLFYQYHPYADVWGPMHWGHAVSRDLLHWQHLPVALAPDAHGMIFSGSVVADTRNTSGLGDGRNPPLVALFTYHDEARKRHGGSGYESQGLAWSVDQGRHWNKYPHNPVLRQADSRDFRDPKVLWCEITGRWVMALAAGDHLALYSSADLIHWRHESDFRTSGLAAGAVWECPDLLPVRVAGQTLWLLIFSLTRGAPNGGTGTAYLIGHFDGHRFEPLDASAPARWLDYGTDDYAGSTFSGAPSGDARTLFLGWMSNWQYAERMPSSPWRGSMTLPRELSLVRAADGIRLRQEPARELQALRTHSGQIGPRSVQGTLDLNSATGVHGGLLEIELRARTPQDGLVLRVANELGEAIDLRIEPRAGRYVLDRSRSGDTRFDPHFAAEQTAPMADPGSDLIDLRAIIDHGSIELYLDGGLTTLTALAFPSQPLDRVSLQAKQPVQLEQLRMHELQSIWR